MEKTDFTIKNDDLIGLDIPKHIFETSFLPYILESKNSKEFLIKNHSYLLFGAPGNGKTFFVNKIFEYCQCKTEIVECWGLKHSFDYKNFLNQKEKQIIYFKDIDAIFNHDEKSEIKNAFIEFIQSISSNIFVIADTNKVDSISRLLVDIFCYKIYFGFPSTEDRIKMLNLNFPENLTHNFLDTFIELSKGFTFSDIVILIKDAKMRPIRRLIENKDDNEIECTENDILSSLHSLKPSYSESERNHFLNVAQMFDFITNIC